MKTWFSLQTLKHCQHGTSFLDDLKKEARNQIKLSKQYQKIQYQKVQNYKRAFKCLRQRMSQANNSQSWMKQNSMAVVCAQS